MQKPAASETHPLIVRITHWVNAAAMILMIGSGWRIYDDSPIFRWLYFPPSWTFGGDPGVSSSIWQNWAYGGLQVHFAAMWVLVINGLIYIGYGVASGRFNRMLFPITLGGIRETLADTLRFKLAHERGVYNHIQRLLYAGVISLGVLVVMSGLAIWKPIQFGTLAALFGSFQGARLVHFLCMAGIVGFLIVHVALALLVPSTLVAMLRGDRSTATAKATTEGE